MVEGLDYSAARFWFDVFQVLLTFAIGVYAWQASRRRATKDAIDRVEDKCETGLDALEGRVDEHRDRLTLVEERLQHLPTTNHVGEVHYRVDQVGQGVKTLEGEMKQINHTLRLIQQHLLEQDK